jgi:hypothetical protein
METLEYLDIQTRRDSRRFVLEQQVIAIGRSDANAIMLPDDPSVSRAHALLERLPAGWAIRDLGSRNGTSVNGKRIWSDRVLHPGDRIEIGSARLVFGRAPSGPADHTVGPDRPPELTRRERDILIELCRPAIAGDVFTEPASIRDIAGTLFITEAAVKQHLSHLYDKFGVTGEGERRRTRLANEAVRRGAIAIADLGAADDAGTTNPAPTASPTSPTATAGAVAAERSLHARQDDTRDR